MNKIRAMAQAVGFCTMGLLALYGLLALCGVVGPLALAAEADARMLNTPEGAAAVLGSTIPQTMNYQGFLRDPDGSPTNGMYTITARIYDLPVHVVTETVFYTTTVPNVTVRDGLFNIVLGDDPPLPHGAYSDAPRYIGIDLNGGGGELIPRQRLHAVPWALTASTLVDNASVNGLSSSGDISVSGNIAAIGKVTSVSTVPGDEATTVATKGYVDTKWPDGPYCIMRGWRYLTWAPCPAGFTEGYICLDTEDDSNGDSSGGTTGANSKSANWYCGTEAGGMVVLNFCCKY